MAIPNVTASKSVKYFAIDVPACFGRSLNGVFFCAWTFCIFNIFGTASFCLALTLELLLLVIFKAVAVSINTNQLIDFIKIKEYNFLIVPLPSPLWKMMSINTIRRMHATAETIYGARFTADFVFSKCSYAN